MTTTPCHEVLDAAPTIIFVSDIAATTRSMDRHVAERRDGPRPLADPVAVRPIIDSRCPPHSK